MITSTLLAIKNAAGKEIDAHFSLEVISGKTTLLIESKGGGTNSPFKRNQDYDQGFRLLLERLALRGATIDDAVVDSLTTQKANLSYNQRRLNLSGDHGFPIELTRIGDFDKLRKALAAAQKPIGQRPDSKGGNGQKRIRLYISIDENGTDLRTLERELAEPPQAAIASKTDIATTASTVDANGHFDPSSNEDARSWILAAIVQRQGQPAFRRKLINAYQGKCAITQCTLEEVLEAAHIVPYNGRSTNAVQNGLLLRSDIHTLFDRGMIAVNTVNWTVLLHTKLMSTQYSNLRGQRLNLPARTQQHPNIAALNVHRSRSGL
ncbi:HNH endonuclease [Archangium lipolyticum]|uniref:HNH endonuclease n=1 Tax=Archangium lipolyticum TaxID=2970465 RepID=UPI00214A4369|nr:HNH endonuclease [Archangium lipolyticum]